MKMVVAVIQPDKVDEVREALVAAEIYRITIVRVTGHGQAQEFDLYRGQKVAPDLHPKVRLEIAVNDEFVDRTVDAIVTASRHGEGQIGDGKVFVMPLEDCVRVRTGERGSSAI